MDARQFRDALGQFATGVTIVTARGAGGERVGATVSSFNSVSLDPPMVLWSLDKRSLSRAAFESSSHFAVHVLALSQQELAHRFAKRGIDKFEGLECLQGLGDVPLLSACSACFECERRHIYDGGDHVIFVGEVKRFKHTADAPLVFHGGTFAETRQLQRYLYDAAIDEGTGRFGPDFISYLIARAHFQLYRPLLEQLDKLSITETEYFTLSALCIRNQLSHADLVSFLKHTGHAPSQSEIADMGAKGLIAADSLGDEVMLSVTEKGRGAYIVILAMDGRIASSALRGITPQEFGELATLLKRLIANTDPGVPDLWNKG